MKKNKNYVSKIVAAMFCLVMLVYGQCGYAVKLTQYKNEYDGKSYMKISLEDEISVITPDVIFEIKKALNDTNILIPINYLDLGNLTFMQGTFPYLLEILRDRKLTMLLLDNCKLGSANAHLIAEFIRNNNIFALNLYGNLLNTRDLQYIIEALRINTSLNTINLGGNDFGQEGIVGILDALRANTSLTFLALSGSSIDDRGALFVASYLHINKIMIELDLSYNHIANNGVIALADSLRENKTLRVLDLEENAIGYEGAHAITDMLRVNQALEDLNLLRNPIGREGTELLLKTIVDNIYLLSIEADWTTSEQKEIIGFVLERNKLIRQISKKINDLTSRINLALLLGANPRVGIDSPLAMLNGYLLREILTNYRENELDIIMDATELQLQEFTEGEREIITRIRGLQKRIVETMQRSSIEEERPILVEDHTLERVQQASDVEHEIINTTQNIPMTNTAPSRIEQLPVYLMGTHFSSQ